MRAKSDRLLGDLLLVALLAAILGPPLGGFILGLCNIVLIAGLAAFEAMKSSPDFSGGLDVWDVFVLPFIYAGFSYVFGFFPAAVAGIAVGLHAIVARRLTFLMCALHVVWATVGYALFELSGDAWGLDAGALMFFLIFLACGLVAAFLLHRWFASYVHVANATAPAD